MIHFTIKGQTPQGGKSACLTCKHASVVRGQNCEERVLCGAGMFNPNGLVRFKVAECAAFYPMNVPWKYEMEQMAWIIEARHRGPKGFEQPEPSEMEVVITKPKDRPQSSPQPTPTVSE